MEYPVVLIKVDEAIRRRAPDISAALPVLAVLAVGGATVVLTGPGGGELEL